MDFNLLFAVIANLSFVIDFEILPERHQDFLFFEGANASAHLFRKNNTVFLNVVDSSFEMYQADIIDKLEFSWKGFEINGSKMEKVKTNGNATNLDFDVFTLLSPILKYEPQEEAIMETILTSEKLNYYYILAIVFLSVLLIDSKPRTFHLLKDIFFRKKESEYEAMKSNYELMRQRSSTPERTV